jgi:hypothetical protein
MTTNSTTGPASSASFGVGRSCYRHLDAGASQTCTSCRQPICEGCVSVGAGYAVVCNGCADASRKRARLLGAACMAGAAVVVVGAIAFVASRPAPNEYGEPRFEFERIEARQAQSPCDGQLTLDLADLLNKERDHRRVVRVVDEFRASCAPVPRLYWESYSARMQLQDFNGAADDAGRLIADDPDDGDFWWWKAKAERQSHDVSAAEADLRRSAEVSGSRAFWAVIDLADLLEEQQRGCEAAPQLARLARNNKDQAEKFGVNTRKARMGRDGCPDPSVLLPQKNEPAPSLCAALPAQLVVDDGRAASGFEFALANSWAAGTRGVAKGSAVVCRAEAAVNDTAGSDVIPSSLRSWSGRLSCAGLPPVTATVLGIGSLEAQEDLIPRLLNQGIARWCGRP